MPLDPHALPCSDIPHFVEVPYVARRLSVGDEFVRDLIRDGKLTAVQLGRRWRIDPADVQVLLEARRRRAKAS